jgi:tetratricopeptide (TPR) repeat protein
LTAGEPQSASRPRTRAHRLAWIFAGALLAVLLVVWIARGPGKSVPPLSGVRSIAVLPFTSLGSSAPGDYLGFGLAEAIVARLTRIPDLAVRPVSSARQATVAGGDAAAAGRRLGADGILEGTLNAAAGESAPRFLSVSGRAGPLDPIRSTSRIRSRFSWKTRSRPACGALALRIAPSEAKHIGAAAPTRDAYEAYLKGRYFWNRRTNEGFQEAVREFQAALSADPRFALAWSGIADARVLLGPQRAVEFRLAREAAEKALAIDPYLAEAHASLPRAKFFGAWDLAGAGREFRRALHLAPATRPRTTGTPTGSPRWGVSTTRSEIRRAREIDPTSLSVNRDVGHLLLYARRYDEAAAALRDTLRMDPSYHMARGFLVVDLCYAGRSEEASAEVRALSAVPGEIGARELEAVIEASAGRTQALRRLLPEKVRKAESGEVGSDAVASDYGWLGEKDEAFRWLERALRERRFYLVFLKADPGFDPLRSDPRFADLVRRVGLPS